ncbi:hypothetical protein GX50_01358 [[Emmonsia] crescens]|uniref:Uncharacterized protein n=1 Tax=[Emmonsia] crescens TaxID=73230 RepID=A0A2B7ZQ40_9EURO|nr:hypothetical protein GX50_01358 [Emmonsia crescens]
MARSGIPPQVHAVIPRALQAANDDEETPLLVSDFPSVGGRFIDEESSASTMLSSSASADGSGFSLATAGSGRLLATNSLLAIALTIFLVLFGFLLYLVLKWTDYRSFGA